MIFSVEKIFFQQPLFEQKVDRGSNTIVVFIHGILSRSESAFKVSNDKEMYWWDIIKNDYPFEKIDFAYFNYNRANVPNLLHFQSMFNDAGKLLSTAELK